MKRNSLIAITALAGAFCATAAQADWLGSGFGAQAASNEVMPPAGYQSQWWTHPSGCEYSRAGRPGETVWYVIVNTIGKRKCPGMIVQNTYSDFQS